MYCPECGQQNDDQAMKCVNCGAVFNNPVTSAPLPDQKVSSHLVPAILVTLFCCLPFGIVAIVYAAMTNGRLKAGDYTDAARTSRIAKIWCWVAFACGIVYLVIMLAAIAIPQFSAYRMRAMDSAAMADLRNAATTQEAYYADYGTYTDSVENLDYSPSPGVTLEILEASDDYYNMTASHEESDNMYRIVSTDGEITEHPK